jgi:hypothetical protein
MKGGQPSGILQMLKHEKLAAVASCGVEKAPCYLRPAKAARHVDVSRALLYGWIGDGLVKSHRVGGIRLVCIQSLEAFVASHSAK